MKIALIGYGKMGKEIEKDCPQSRTRDCQHHRRKQPGGF